MTQLTTEFEASLSFARLNDQDDSLSKFREEFIFPLHQGKPALYFCGNSLGLQPKTTAAAVQEVLEKWGSQAVEGHFTGQDQWLTYHRLLSQPAAELVGAYPQEVVLMNNLTANLHLMMVSFYQPTARRYKIIMEAGAFPSDQYAVESQVRFHGLRPEDAIIEIAPRAGEHLLRTEDILHTITQTGEELALVLMGGINYYTGQLYDMQAITHSAHKAGAFVGFDLAHAAGNVPMSLHEWGPDFAVWCTYKYLNSSPGGISGVFVHERHAQNPDLPRFAGWWGHNEQERFLMQKGFKPMPGAEGWQLSNAPILLMAAHKASLAVFQAAGGMQPLREKSKRLTSFLAYLVGVFNQQQPKIHIRILTPADPAQRGCQLSLDFSQRGKEAFRYLLAQGVIGDWREPNVIRLAPTPLYNSFEDVYRVYDLLCKWVATL